MKDRRTLTSLDKIKSSWNKTDTMPPAKNISAMTENLYENIFNQLIDEVHIWKLVRCSNGKIKTWRLVDANSAALKSWGKNLDDIVGKTTDEIFPGTNATEQLLPVVEKIFSEDKAYEWEEYFEGTNQFLLMKSIPFGEYFVSTGVDITELKTTQKDLQYSNLRLSEATNAGGVAIWDWDIEHDVLIWDPLMFEMYGIPENRDANKVSLWEEALHPDDKARAIQALHDALNEVKDYDVEFRIQRPGGEIRYIKAAATIRRNKVGEAVRMVGTNLDVTESRRAEDKIKKLEKRNRALLDYSPASHKIVDLDYKLRYMNRNGYKMLCLPINDDWLGKPYPFAFFPADAKRLIEEKLAYVKRTKEPVTFESIAHDSNGNELWKLHNIIPIFKNDVGELDYLTVVSADITERKLANQKALDASKKFEQLVDLLPLGIYTTDIEGDCTFVSRGWSKMAGFGFDQAKGKGWVKAVHEEDRDYVFSQWTQMVKSRGTWGVDYRFVNTDGNVTDIYGIATEITDNEDNVTGFLGVNLDVTEKNILEEQLAQLQKMDAIGQLAGGVAHDFNNQLAGISGYAELLELEVTSKRAKDYLSKIIASTKRSGDLTRQLLNYSRKQKLMNDNLDVHSELDDTLELLKHAVDKRIDIQKHYCIAKCVIRGDSSTLQNAFLNVAINASDAMKDGGLLTVTTETVAPSDDKRLPKYSTSANEYVKVVFEDTGEGIAKELLEKVYEPFFTTKAVGKGTGMGLASVYGIVSRHEGFSYIESELGTGTRVYVYLPVSPEVAPEPVAGDKRLLTQENTGKAVLVVDDEQVLRELCQDFLTASGYSVLLATNGQEGVDVYREHYKDIAVVLMDLAMPVMSGHDACKALSAINPDVKIIISSGYDSDMTADTQKSDNISAFIEKPYQLNELKETIIKVLD